MSEVKKRIYKRKKKVDAMQQTDTIIIHEPKITVDNEQQTEATVMVNNEQQTEATVMINNEQQTEATVIVDRIQQTDRTSCHNCIIL